MVIGGGRPSQCPLKERTWGGQTVLSVPFLLSGSLSAMQCNIRRALRNK
jgi:hypothetical protein